MVLESLTNPYLAKKDPKNLILIGFFITIIGNVIASSIFDDPSLAGVFFTAMAAAPLMVSLVKEEEIEEEIEIKFKYFPFKKTHKNIFFVFLFLFLGSFMAYTLLSVFLPESYFKVQLDTIKDITGGVLSESSFWIILLNNIKVMIVFLIFSFLYGAGAVFILSWNASVIGVATGSLIKQEISSGLHVIPLAILRYMTHGVLEITAYLLAGIAGSILSAALIRKKLNAKEILNVFLDLSDLLITAIIFLIVGAIVEITISPKIM